MQRLPHDSAPCPLCAATAGVCSDDAVGRFFACAACDLIFRDPAQHLASREAEARYREHRNSLDDPRYLAFLSRLVEPLATRLAPGARGLDYGCGPVPAVALLLDRLGFACESWDPLFHPDTAPLDARYDFVTSTEVIEHVAEPPTFLDALERLVRPRGIVALMTQFRDESRPFDTWWYRRDPTHVCFYSARTMDWIARARHWELELAAPGVTLFTLPG